MRMELHANLIRKVTSYKASPAVLDAIRDVPLLFAVGITAAGKNALLHRLLELHPDDYALMVSHTSRAPRLNHGIMERDGIEYYFVDNAAIEQMLEDHLFIEAQVIHNAWVSGSTVKEVQRIRAMNRIAVTDIDVQGIDVYVQLGLNVKPVFILPPSFEIWMQRLMGRYEGKPHQHDLALRLQSAVREIEHAIAADHFYIVINDDLDDAVSVVHDIACGEAVDPHYHKAMATAETLLARIREELARIV